MGILLGGKLSGIIISDKTKRNKQMATNLFDDIDASKFSSTEKLGSVACLASTTMDSTGTSIKKFLDTRFTQ